MGTESRDMVVRKGEREQCQPAREKEEKGEETYGRGSREGGGMISELLYGHSLI